MTKLHLVGKVVKKTRMMTSVKMIIIIVIHN